MNRDFKGVWIPKEVWLNPELKIMEKLFLVEIDSLDGAQGCFASNAHFAEFFDISKGRCTQIIKSLEAKGIIKIQLTRNGKQITKRTIKVVNKLTRVVKKLNRGSEKTKLPYLENAEGSNTSNSNTKRKAFTKPTREEIESFSFEFNLNLTGFFDYYSSNGWKVGKNPMKDWNAAARGWSTRQSTYSKSKQPNELDFNSTGWSQ